MTVSRVTTHHPTSHNPINTMLATAIPTGHLDYYKLHGINPVRYEMDDLQLHFDRRGALYRGLGVTPLAVRGARVIEVAPGTGQNSLYVASLNPAELTLVEPNPVAIRDITALYETPGLSPVEPRLVTSTFQDYSADRDFDLVICENWLGHSDQERGLLRKLGQLVSPRGLLVVTTVSPVGLLPNVLRKALACRIDDPAATFADRTAVLCEAFGPHLRSIPAMTRSVIDWVHDNAMNPAYFGIRLTIPMVVEDLGGRFDVLGSSPRFASDWRWFKALAGDAREFNRHFLDEYRSELHNFLDYRTVLPPRDGKRNADLETSAWEVGERARELELEFYAGRPTGPAANATAAAVRRIVENLSDMPSACAAAFDEFLSVFSHPRPTATRVAAMRQFGGLFGRETVYVSLERRP